MRDGKGCKGDILAVRQALFPHEARAMKARMRQGRKKNATRLRGVFHFGVP